MGAGSKGSHRRQRDAFLMAHIAESLHWYDRTGGPAYTVKAKDGTERPTTLRDARKLDLVPSVTTIIRCAAAPGLENWKAQQVLLAALTTTRREDEQEAAYLQRIMDDSREQAKKAAERGTAIHAAIQGYFEGNPAPAEFWPHVEATDKAVTGWGAKVNNMGWTPEASFSHPLGFGGKVDISHLTGLFIADFKTKEFAEDNRLKTWDEHAMQLAAYREGLGLPAARCAIVYVSVSNPGLAKLIEIPEQDLVRGWDCFKSLLQFWQAKNRYWPNREAIAA